MYFQIAGGQVVNGPSLHNLMLAHYDRDPNGSGPRQVTFHIELEDSFENPEDEKTTIAIIVMCSRACPRNNHSTLWQIEGTATGSWAEKHPGLIYVSISDYQTEGRRTGHIEITSNPR